ncbi:MAG TPA: thiamine pyrophosphate-binding protein [Candidatus Limnocylindria bacterium]|jgi:thiamine pyrophosphate-dependent acetolactate synthase large subunit-like protein|nr:thiamine pyrophosphate-binding protein [Candidatus Limnocylindria bacterium]
MSRTRRYGSDVIVDLLRAFDIDYVALNPGASYRGLHDSLVNYGENKPEIILCTHEEIAVSIAHGYAKVTGRPMAAAVHDVVGLLHATMTIYYAHVDRAPVLVLGATGPVDRTKRRPYIDWIHTALVNGNAVRDYTKWDDQPASVADFPASFARAYRIATTEPCGPVYLCYDAGLQEQQLDAPIDVSEIAAGARPSPVQADPAAIQRAADLIARAARPVIVTEFTGRHPEAVAQLIALAEETASAVIDLNGRVNFPNRHPQNLTGGDALADADVVLLLDVGDPFRALNELDRLTNEKKPRITAGCPVIDIGLAELRQSKWSEDLGQFQPVALSVVADTSLAIPELRGAVRERAGGRDRSARCAELRRVHDEIRARWEKHAREDWDSSPLTAPRLASEIWSVIKGEDWILTSNTLEDWALRLWDVDGPSRHPGRSFGTATQIGTSVGVGLAYRGTERLVVDIQPDGDLLYDPGALWTAAHHRIPLLVVMYNNRAYYNDWEHQLRVAQHRGTPKENARIGQELDDPAPDFAMLARSFGWHAEGPIADPAKVRPALERALEIVRREKRPALVDTIVRHRSERRYR